uniref:Uncharacterized protein n=1 Tax=Strongyloides papillosus TaxID=174720 RepID=A0A0N5C8J6_STREA
MSINIENVTTFPSQSNYIESNNNDKLKQSLPSYNEVINSSEFNDILRNSRYSRLQYLVPKISCANEHPPIFTAMPHQDIECGRNKNEKIKFNLFAISIFLIIMIPAVFILIVIVTNTTTN